MKPHKVFIGYDKRQPLAYTVLAHSIVANSTEPVSVTPLILSQLPSCKVGLTEFTYSRYLVPWLCDYEGVALFLDSDMVVTGDVSELFGVWGARDNLSVYIVKDQPRFEWSSMMLFNNEKCTGLTPEYINSAADPASFEWANGIGVLPSEWNHCVGYRKPADAKLYHYTMGIPCHEQTGRYEAGPWKSAMKSAFWSDSYEAVMGQSVHLEKLRQLKEDQEWPLQHGRSLIVENTKSVMET